MPGTKRRPGKRHRPPAVLRNPLDFLVPAKGPAASETMLRFETALATLERHEHPGVNEWRDLADAINVLESLVIDMRRLSRDVLPTLHEAADSMAAAGKRWHEGKGMRLDGPGLLRLRHVIELYAACLETLAAADMDKARVLTEKRVADLARGVRPSDGREVIAV